VTITSTIRCDLCGKTEPYPDATQGKESTWFPYMETAGLRELTRPMCHCCSVECYVKHRNKASRGESWPPAAEFFGWKDKDADLPTGR
jgi:hypothetical protein